MIFRYLGNEATVLFLVYSSVHYCLLLSAKTTKANKQCLNILQKTNGRIIEGVHSRAHSSTFIHKHNILTFESASNKKYG